MEALKKALAEVNAIEARFHELVEPEKAMRDALFATVRHAGEAIVSLGEKVEALGARLKAIEKPAEAAPTSEPAAPVPQEAEPAAAVSNAEGSA